MQIKATHHVAIFTRQFDAMLAFYTQTLGLKITRRWDDVTIVFIDIGSTTIELIGRDTAPPAGSEPGAIHHIALHVDSVDAGFAEWSAKGVRVKSAPANFKDVRICFFYDPDGNTLELVEDPAQAA
jgi:catechol 2,3-dioxygenase-like lactoylglutathione lyase family enzyme